MYKLSKRSINNLKGVHPQLIACVYKALESSETDFSVIEGIRTLDRQKALYEAGKSQTMQSKHLTGHAVDIVPYPCDWNDIDSFKLVMKAMKDAADKLGISLTCGGDWNTFKDYPHYQIKE